MRGNDAEDAGLEPQARRARAVRPAVLLAVATLAVSASWVAAQTAPESLLPPGFDEPRPAPTARPRATPAPRPAAPPRRAATAPQAAASHPATAPARPVARPLPAPPPGAPPAIAGPPTAVASGAAAAVGAGVPAAPAPPSFAEGGPLPPIAALEQMSPAQIDQALGLNARADTPPGARRSDDRAGVIDASEGGLAGDLLAGQDASLVRAAIAGNDGLLVSRWGHILLRRALVSRMAPPIGMAPGDFAALRAALLVRMGEGDAARALVQDIDVGGYTPALSQAALDAYVATADFTGICPVIATQGPVSGASAGPAAKGVDPRWQVAGTICAAFTGDGGALARLDRAIYRGLMPRLDLLLAEKYVGAAGRARRAVTIDWTGIDDMTPWRFGLTLAVGLQPPDAVMQDSSPYYAYVAATAPMLGLAARAAAADRAGGAGILSSAAMVDLYSQIYANADVTGAYGEAADKLREAYVAGSLGARFAAIDDLWSGGGDAQARYSRQVLTAYAAARLPVSASLRDDAGDLIATMLTAGLDANAARWSAVAAAGSLGWAQLALAAPAAAPADSGAIASFIKQDRSDGRLKSGLLVAGLAGLGRITPDAAGSLAADLKINLAGQTRWTRMIDRAAQVDNPALVALLAGVGMQGDGWRRMTPRYLFHIVAALRVAGFEPEARMIAAEAVARG